MASGLYFYGGGANTTITGNTAGGSATTLTIGSGGISFTGNGTNGPAYVTVGGATDTVVVAASQTWGYAAGTGGRTLTVGATGASVVGSATSGNTTTLSLWSANGGVIVNGATGDGANGGKLAVALTTLGTGLVTLNAASASNTYSGGTIVDAGVLSVAGGSNLGTGYVGIGSGVLRLGSTSNWTSTNLNSGGKFLVPATGGLSIAANVLNFSGGAGNVPIDSASAGFIGIDSGNYNSGINLSNLGNGSMFLGSTLYNGTINNGTLVAGVGSTYRLGAGGGATPNFTGNTSIAYNNGTLNITVANMLTGSTSLVVGEPLANAPGVLGYGTVAVTKAENYTGNTTVNLLSTLVGTAQTSGTPFGNSTNTNTVALNGGTLALIGTPGTATSTTIGNLNFNGTAAINGYLVTTPTKVTTLTIGGATGLTRQNNGVLQIVASYASGGQSNPLGSATAGTNVIVTNPGIDLTPVNGIVAPYYQDASGNFLTYVGGTVPGSGFAPITTVPFPTTGGSVGNVSTGAAAFAVGATDATVNSLVLTGNLTNTSGTARTLTVTSGGLSFSNNYSIGNATAANAVNLAFGSAEAIISVGGASGAQIQNVISGSGGLTKAGTGSLTLYGTNTFTGQVTINSGTITVQSADANLGDSGNNIFINGGSLYFNAGNITDARKITFGSNGGTVSSNTNTSLTLNGKLTGTANYVGFGSARGTAGSGTIVLGNATNDLNDFTAPIFISGNLAPTLITFPQGGANTAPTTLSITADSNLGNAGNSVTLNGGNAILQAKTNNITTSRNFFLNALGGSIDTTTTTYTASGVISGNGNLTKVGTGTLVLSGINTYTGATNINAGKLLVDGSLAAGSTVTVGFLGTLGGHGTINGTVNVNGILSPGNSAGQITIGTLGLGSGSTTHMEIGGTTLGTDYDNVTITGASGLSYGGTLEVVAINSFDLSQTGSYSLFTLNSGSALGDFTAVTVGGTALTNSSGVWTGGDGTSTYQFTDSTGTLMVIPEPATLGLMLGLASLGVLARRRRQA